MRAVSLAVVAVASMGLIVRAEAPAAATTPSIGCPACPLALPPPAPPDDPTLPPLPAQSPRNANYTIDARLDAEQHTIQGSLILEWRNTTGQPQSVLPFHLYWNAFRNTLSTSARGEGRRSARVSRGRETRGFGYIQIASVHQLTDGAEADLTPSLRYVQPDDANADDRTVAQVQTPAPVAPDATARFKIEWTAQMPYGDVGRSGWVHDYHFVAQWFPKIGVWWKGAWNAHQFHPFSEFFSDYGVYDVRLTVPQGFILGATGAMKNAVDNPDGTRTFHFHQDDVHDFAWVTSRRMGEVRARFDEPGHHPVDIRLLLQPEHAHLAARYVEATKISLRSYGAWSAPYPYDQITVVDPAWTSASGGMEYPTLFTGGASVFSPPALQSPESVTIHECGHQFWYLLVGTNEFEEAWLDEGFNSYHDEKAAQIALGPVGWGHRYFGMLGTSRGNRAPIPVVAPDVWLGRG
ncbi:MAG TPA: M1 family metallopeptidase, partial [Vicinamibacteria bacterium]|nr:M1 family metallopeptidase [Vicinamibacteria bacterium]